MEYLQLKTHTKKKTSQTLQSCLMHVLVYISKNQENLKLLSNINVYLLNANSSEYMTEKNNQERESRSKSDKCCSKLVMLTEVTNGGGLTGSKETILESDDP